MVTIEQQSKSGKETLCQFTRRSWGTTLGPPPSCITLLTRTSPVQVATERSENGYAEQAEMYSRQALELRGRLLGFHQDTARSHVFLSDVLFILGNFQPALDELQKALQIQKELLGPEHKNTTNTLNKMADLGEKIGCKDKTKEM